MFKNWIESHLWEGDADSILRRAADFGARMGGRNAQQILKVVHARVRAFSQTPALRF